MKLQIYGLLIATGIIPVIASVFLKKILESGKADRF
jgi:hypothetical protein